MPTPSEAVLTALSRHLDLPVDHLRARQHDALDQLGLDSHGLMRVLVDIERSLALPRPLDLSDEALATPASLIAAVESAHGAS